MYDAKYESLDDRLKEKGSLSKSRYFFRGRKYQKALSKFADSVHENDGQEYNALIKAIHFGDYGSNTKEDIRSDLLAGIECVIMDDSPSYRNSLYVPEGKEEIATAAILLTKGTVPDNLVPYVQSSIGHIRESEVLKDYVNVREIAEEIIDGGITSVGITFMPLVVGLVAACGAGFLIYTTAKFAYNDYKNKKEDNQKKEENSQ